MRNSRIIITITVISILTFVFVTIPTVTNSQITSLSNSRQANLQTPEELIQKIYRVHQPWVNKRINLDQESVISQYFDKEMTNLIIKDIECAKKNGTCNIDSDLFANTQNTINGYKNLKIRRLKSNPEVVIETTFNLIGRSQQISFMKLTYHTKMTIQGWRISDIIYAQENGTFSLKSSLLQPIK